MKILKCILRGIKDVHLLFAPKREGERKPIILEKLVRFTRNHSF